MLKAVYLYWVDDRKSTIRIVDYNNPDKTLSPELLDPTTNEQYQFWIARMGDPIYNFGLDGKTNMKILARNLGFWPSPMGARFEFLDDVSFDDDLPF